MSLNSTSGSVVGSAINTEVSKQLSARVKLHSDKIGFTDDHLFYLNGSTGWVRISSAVDTFDITTKAYSNNLAKGNVLIGGTLANGTSIRQGIFSSNSSYEGTVQGYRPMAGVTGFTVVSRSYGGATKSGTISLTINSVEDLTKIEQLYFRPGFTILVEYGHSIYLDNDGNLQKDSFNMTNFFDYTSRKKIREEGMKLRKDSNYNYDFMHAYVTNFSWESNDMGGYNCNVSFVSAGDLIDSLSIAITGGSSISAEADASKNLKTEATSLHTLLYVISNAESSRFFDKETLKNDDSSALREKTIDEALVKYCDPLWSKIKKNLDDNDRSLKVYRAEIGTASQTSTWFRYINFAALLEMINQCFIPQTSTGEKIFNFFIGKDSSKQTYFTTFEQHFCVDPGIAIIPKSYTSTTNYKIDIAKQDCGVVDENDILDIQINVDYVLELLNTILQQDKLSDKSIYDLISAILSRFNDTFGLINDFKIHTDDDTEVQYIIDGTIVPDATVMKDPKYKLQIFGVNSTVETFKLGSAIPSSMTAYVAAAASATSSDLRSRLHAQFRWNEGLEDRTSKSLFLEEKIYNKNSSGLYREQVLLARYLKKLNASEFFLNYNSEEVLGVKQAHQKLMSVLLEYHTNGSGTNGTTKNASGLIPLTLSMTMKGISGLKIGETFTITDALLPERYQGRTAFMINHLSNSIVNNKWITEITAQTFSLDTLESLNSASERELKNMPEINADDLEKEFNVIVNEASDELPDDLTFTKPLPTLTIRNDNVGRGAFGESRKRTEIKNGVTTEYREPHEGVDYEAAPGTKVRAIIDGDIAKYNNYSKGFSYLQIKGTGKYQGITVDYGYVDWVDAQLIIGRFPIIKKEVTKGEIIGEVLNLKDPGDSSTGEKYPDNIINHIHLAVKYNGTSLDAEKLNWA